MKTFPITILIAVVLTANFSLQAQNAGDYRTAANKGDKYAQYNLGVCYLNGTGCTKDDQQAVYWLTKSANQGFVYAQYNLGLCYDKGLGVAQDYKQAAYWYTKSANQGDASSQVNLGAYYEKGKGVAQDFKQAVYWYTKAANQGNSMAQYNLAKCYYNGNGVTQDYKQAVSWYTKAANQGLAAAQNKLGYCYYSGKGVAEDYQQAVYWYRKATNQENAEAQMNLGLCYYFGQGVAMDHEQASFWWNKAINNPNSDDELKQYSMILLSWIDSKKSSNNLNNDEKNIINSNKSLSFNVNGVSFTMMYVEGGTFQMGATSEQCDDAYDNEKPVHNVTLNAFYLGETEVTQDLWKAVMGNNPSNCKGDNLPVESINWDDCQLFIKKLNQITGQEFRLPTEAEWEFAARGGNQSNKYKYAGSNKIDDVAWYFGNSGNRIHKVKEKQPNELGLYDMSGNVSEWCSDWWGDYSNGSFTNPKGPSKDSHNRHSVRGGGSIRVGNSHIRHYRVSDRSFCSYSFKSDSRGLRLCLPKTNH